MEQAVERAPTLLVAHGCLFGEIVDGGLRHDLPPVDASQVAGVFSADEAIGDEDIVEAIIIEIEQPGSPGPASHGNACAAADVGEWRPWD